jgi:multidrug efflux system membrane fusion protein
MNAVVCHTHGLLGRGVRVGVAAGALGVMILLEGCGKKADEAQGMPPSMVTAATAVAKDVPLYLDTIGQTTAYESVNIVSQVEGQIVEMPFTQGTMVQKGDVLVEIYKPPFEAAVEKAAGAVATDKANLTLAQYQMDRSAPLLKGSLISKQQYDSYVAQVDATKGQLQSDEGDLATAQINLDYATIIAPVDGMVGTYNINVGNVVKVNDVAITTIQQMDPLYADFVVAVTDFPEVVKYFKQYNGRLPVHVESLSDASRSLEGNLTILGNAIAASTGTVTVRTTLANPDQLFWPNQPVRARIILDTLKDAVLVPDEAVQLNQQGRYVFVVAPPKAAGGMATVEQRPVEIGQLQEGSLRVVTSGVKAGEVVVVRNQLFLQPGGEVVVESLDGKDLMPAAGPGGAPGAAPAGNGTAAPGGG